jgi:hypothetical protein
MGQSLQVRGNPDLAALLAKLPGTTLLMVDGQLVSPKVSPPSTWQDVRLKTPAGTVTLKRQGDHVSLTVFGNADEALIAMQQRIAEVVGEPDVQRAGAD